MSSEPLIPLLLTKREVRALMVAIKARQDDMERSWRTTGTLSYHDAMCEFQKIRLSLQRQAKTR